MSELYLRLEVGFASDDLRSAAALVERWLGQALVSDDDLELGGEYFRHAPEPLPESGLCGVRVTRNHIADLGWRLEHRQDLPVCAQIEVYGPELLVLGTMASRLEQVAGGLASVATYTVSRSSFNAEDPALPRAHTVRFDPRGVPGAEYPDLLSVVTFGLEAKGLKEAGEVASALLESFPAERESPELGGLYLELAGANFVGLVRSNQVSPVAWICPRHKRHALLLDVTWKTPSLLEMGKMSRRAQEVAAGWLALIGYRVVGDLVRDRVPRLLTYEFE